MAKNELEMLQEQLEKLDIEDLAEMAEIEEEIEERDKMEAAKFYVPNGKADEFIKLVGSDKHFVNMFIGANGTSKTGTGANVVANIIFGVQSEWFKGLPLFEKFPYIKKGRIISDPTTIKEKIVPELIKWLPRNSYKNFPEKLYETTKEGKYYASKFIFNNGWVIDIMSNEQDKTAFESVDLGFLWIDEPMPKDKFIASLARGRLGMICFWTYTPLFEAGWIKDWIDTSSGIEGMCASVEAEAEDNCKIHGVRGFFEHKHIQRMADAYPEDEKEARVFGKFGHLLGRVHKKFNRKVHVIKAFPLNDRDWTTYKALDPHPRVADHVLYMSVNKKGDKIVSGELLSEGLIKQCYQRMKDYEASMQFRMEGRIIDPSAFNDDQHKKEKSVGSQLYDLGETYIKGSKNLMAGIKRLETAFDYEIKAGKFIRAPEVFIFDNCVVTIKQIEEYVWAEHRGRSADDKEQSGRPKDKNDHMPENLHRLILHEPKFVPYEFRNGARAVPTSSGMSDVADNDFDPYA